MTICNDGGIINMEVLFIMIHNIDVCSVGALHYIVYVSSAGL